MTEMNEDGTFEHNCKCMACIDELITLSNRIGILDSMIREIQEKLK